jgi:hypothetical protein
MNKILFKLIEGKGKFFLMRDVPKEPRPCMLMNKIYGPTIPEKRHYQEDLNACISEALKNGEIVNPEVLPIRHSYTPEGIYYIWEPLPTIIKALKDGDTFDLPEGIGFEEFKHRPGNKWIEAIRLLSEKPVQKETPFTKALKESKIASMMSQLIDAVPIEESQEELWKDAFEYLEPMPENQKLLLPILLKRFTIKRKES